MTLEELKAQNAAIAAKEQESQPDEYVKEAAADDTLEVDESTEAKGDETAEGVETEIPLYMQTDEQTSTDDQGVPVAKHVAVKHKLKARIDEQKSELDVLKAKIEQLEQGGQQPAAPKVAPAAKPMPTLAECDYDESKFGQEVSDWHNERINSTLDSRLQQQTQQAQVKAAQDKQQASIDQHYDRAAQLIGEHGLEAEDYRNADSTIRQAIHEATGQGDLIADALISELSALGNGSEKVWLSLGRNKAQLNKLKQALIDDPRGLKAMGLLGSMQSQYERASNLVSKAPKPGTKLKGDTKSVDSHDGLKRKYLAAHKSGDGTRAFEIRQQARAAGANVSNWT